MPQDKAGGRRYNPGQIHEIEAIIAETTGYGERKFVVKWLGWDHTYNTEEPESNILDKSIILKWDDVRPRTVDSEEAVYMLRAAFAADLLKLKEPTWGMTVSVPACALTGVATKILGFLSGFHDVPLEVLDEGNTRTMSVQLDTFDQIGDLLHLELIHPEKMFGAACVRKGRRTQKEIWVAGPPFVLSCAAPPRTTRRATLTPPARVVGT